jgi:fumarate hydratase class II
MLKNSTTYEAGSGRIGTGEVPGNALWRAQLKGSLQPFATDVQKLPKAFIRSLYLINKPLLL